MIFSILYYRPVSYTDHSFFYLSKKRLNSLHNLGFRLKQRSHGRHEGIHYNMRLERSTLWHEVQFILIYVRLSIVINNENVCCALTELKVVQQHWHWTWKGWPNILLYTRYMQNNS
jgi:hypothetical protein